MVTRRLVKLLAELAPADVCSATLAAAFLPDFHVSRYRSARFSAIPNLFSDKVLRRFSGSPNRIGSEHRWQPVPDMKRR
jgi:hypothetical protein